MKGASRGVPVGCFGRMVVTVVTLVMEMAQLKMSGTVMRMKLSDRSKQQGQRQK